MKKNSPLIFLLFISVIYSCGYKKNYVEDFNNKRPPEMDFFRDVPNNKSGKPIIFSRFKNQYEKKFNLYSLDNGFDSIEIRIWCNLIVRPPGKQNLIIFKNSKRIWTGSIIQYEGIYNPNDHFSIDSFKSFHVRNMRFQNDFSSFINCIFSYDLLSLPDYNMLTGYPSSTSPGIVNIEIATKKLYRVYSYEEPFDAKANFPEAEKLIKILSLVEGKFNLTLFEKY
jgi:hypothetical protein